MVKIIFFILMIIYLNFSMKLNVPKCIFYTFIFISFLTNLYDEVKFINIDQNEF